ncbi:hypothetical protein MNBD_GAMMA03-271 [hydrothermal vent metagenome]|uniref:Uncharacterized protein n=1 Tax=hydrothermal vent metagenome TaxID=652676 RepID=A0A3B0WFY3_9ZZZZ
MNGLFRIIKFNSTMLISLFFIISVQSCANHSPKNVTFSEKKTSPLKLYDQIKNTYTIVPRDRIEILTPVKKKNESVLALNNSLAFELIDNELYSRQEIEVNPYGEIYLPLIGKIKISSLTVTEANKLLLDSYKKIYKKPRVFLKVTKYTGYDQKNKVAIMGEVIHPGIYFFQHNTSILKTLSMAGGHKNTAELKSIIVIKNGHTKTPQYIKINFQDILNGFAMKKNIQLSAGDIVYVPKSYIAKIDNFVDLFMARIRPAAQTYLDFYYAINARATTPILSP